MTDELKPVRGGCGGEAWAMMALYPDYAECPYICQCRKCHIKTVGYETKAEAIEAWNKAMGSAEKSSVVERTAKAEYSNADGEYLCSECGRVVQIEDAYCCGCGARLEWDE